MKVPSLPPSLPASLTPKCTKQFLLLQLFTAHTSSDRKGREGASFLFFFPNGKCLQKLQFLEGGVGGRKRLSLYSVRGSHSLPFHAQRSSKENERCLVVGWLLLLLHATCSLRHTTTVTARVHCLKVLYCSIVQTLLRRYQYVQ